MKSMKKHMGRKKANKYSTLQNKGTINKVERRVEKVPKPYYIMDMIDKKTEARVQKLLMILGTLYKTKQKGWILSN